MTETTEVTEQEYRQRAGAMTNMLTVAPQRHNQRVYGGVKPANECGTTGCVAGWGLLAARGVVTIEPDGAMTWEPGELETGAGYTTLWRPEYDDRAWAEGREWFGLNDELASLIFEDTLYLNNPAAGALAVLRRLADGRVSRHDILTLDDVEMFLREDAEAAR